MRAAPPVQVRLSAGRAERMLITGLHTVAAWVPAAWLMAHAGLPWWWQGAAVLLAGSAALGALGWWLARRALPPQPGLLAWDGAGWLATGLGVQPLQRLVVALDLGLWVLLQLHPQAARPAWRVCSRAADPAGWHGLRLALGNHAGQAAAQADADADAGAAR